MKKSKAHWLALVLGAAFVAQASAQAPVVPGAPPVAPPPPPAAGAAAAAAPKNIFSMFCMTPEQKEACKLCFCNSILGKIVTGMLRPVSVFTGGLVQDRCAIAQATEDLKKPADSAEGAAARIKADEAEAKARREAIRYLGTVDCHYWPEAEEGLINGLRADRNECVRLEAAIVLGRGCCCTKKTIEALAIVVSGDDRDGNPSENSERVKNAAFISLNNCLACQPPAPAEEVVPPVKDKDEPIGPPKDKDKDLGDAHARAKTDGKSVETSQAKGTVKGDVKARPTPAEYYQKIEKMSMAEVVENARRALAQTGQAIPMVRTGNKGVFDVIALALNGPQSAPLAPPVAPRMDTPVAASDVPAPMIVPAQGSKVEPTLPTMRIEASQIQRIEPQRPLLVPPPVKVEPPSIKPLPNATPYQPTPPVKIDSAPARKLPAAKIDSAPQAKLPPLLPLRTETAPKIPFATLTPPVKSEPSKTTSFSSTRTMDSGLPATTNLPQQTKPATPQGGSAVVKIVWHDEPNQPSRPAANGPALPVEIQKRMSALQNGRTVEERQRAAEDLGNSVWSSHPDVTRTLTTASLSDLSPAVRQTCQRYLARINVNR